MDVERRFVMDMLGDDALYIQKDMKFIKLRAKRKGTNGTSYYQVPFTKDELVWVRTLPKKEIYKAKFERKDIRREEQYYTSGEGHVLLRDSHNLNLYR